MRVSTILALILAVALLALAACNKPAQPGKSGAAGDSTASGQTTGEAGQSGQTTAEKPPERVPTPPDPIVGGTWYALFGRHSSGVVEDEFENGHRVRFVADGMALWVVVEKGWDKAAMQSKYEVTGNKIQIRYSPASAVKLGVAQVAPLGLGRDEEIGLLSKTPGRDTEIGLNQKTGGPADATAERVEELTFTVDGELLVLADSKANVMVYARVPEAEVPAATDLSGNWTGTIGTARDVPATASWDGTTLTLKLDAGQGEFRGKYVQGLYVGKLTRGNNLALAAIVPEQNGGLNGLLLADPYTQADPAFDFTKAAPPPPPPAG